MKVMKKVFSAYKNGEVYEAKQNETGTLAEVKFAVLRPNQRAQSKAQEFYNRRFAELIKAGTLVGIELEKETKKRDLWGPEKKAEMEVLTKKLTDGETTLLKGGIRKSEGRKVALEMVKSRNELIRLSSEGNRLNQLSAEGQSENTRFNYLIFNGTVYEEGDNSGKKYFNSYEDFLDSDDIVINLAGQALMDLLYDPIETQKQLPEWKFLIKMNFCDEKLRFLNKEGKLSDEEGKRLVNEDGRFINEAGAFVDRDGKLVDAEGAPIVEFAEFLDD